MTAVQIYLTTEVFYQHIFFDREIISSYSLSFPSAEFIGLFVT